MKEKLENLLNEMNDWDKQQTSIPGVKIIKIPENKFSPARLAIEICPLNEKGKPIKRKGTIIISNEDLFDKYKAIFDHEKVLELIMTIDEIREESEIILKKSETENTQKTFEL